MNWIFPILTFLFAAMNFPNWPDPYSMLSAGFCLGVTYMLILRKVLK